MSFYAGQKVRIQPNVLTVYPFYERDAENDRPRNQNSIDNLSKVRTVNKVSPKSQRKIRAAVNWLTHAARDKRVFSKKHGHTFNVRLVFVTLTTPLQFSDANVVQMKEQLLQPWLAYARKYFGLNNYIWKAERGHKGHIHFHLTADVVIPHYRIRQSWNRIMQKRGMLEAFHAKHKHYDANSIDIHSVRGIRDLAAEICKYMSKSETQGKFIDGRLWGCSYDLSKATNTVAEICVGTFAYDTMNNWASRMKSKAVELMSKKHGRMIQVATLFFPTPKDWIHQKMGEITRLYDEVMWRLQTGHECLPLYVLDN